MSSSCLAGKTVDEEDYWRDCIHSRLSLTKTNIKSKFITIILPLWSLLVSYLPRRGSSNVAGLWLKATPNLSSLAYPFCSFPSRGLAQKRRGEGGEGPNGGGRVGRSFVVRKEQTTAGAYRTIFEWRQRRSLVLYWLSIHCNCKLLKFCRVSTNRNSRGLTATLDDKKLLDCIILLF